MQLEDYFDFLAPDDIRVKGTRIGIESILYEFIHRAQSPEDCPALLFAHAGTGLRHHSLLPA
jgi:hypothetical protein